MPNNNPINDKKKALLAYKEKILEEIQYYDKRIEEFPTKHRNNCYYDDPDSSDSEDYFPTSIDTGPDVGQLKLQQGMLKTCLQATQELTSLIVLQSEVNVLVQDPDLNGESPVTEPGTWKEVTAECRIDLVPFTITFYMHTPNRKFAPTSYRGLQVSLVKTSHEVELNSSVLHTLKRPSDAIEVVRSYAVGYRSRRTTLARLANKYASSLFMEPHPEGGFVLKCANLVEILWRLENKWSPVAPFHHRMKFDLEYMDEAYIKIITQAHKQLLDPTIQTDERSLLLAKIINVCLQAKGPIDSESDVESRQTDMRTETEAKDKDSEVMAPPKSLPKKTKKTAVKDKEANKNLAKDSVPKKRSAEDENNGGNNKKIKTGEDGNSEVKIIFKAKERSGQQSSKKDKNINVDTEGHKKKHIENVVMKKISNEDKVQQTNKNNKHDHVNVATIVTNDDITEKNKPVTNKNMAKKRINNDKVSDMPNASKNGNKELKRVKSNEEIKRKTVQTGESARASHNIKEKNQVETIKNIAKKGNNNDNGAEVTKTSKNDNKELKKARSNEEIKRKNVQTIDGINENSKNLVKKTNNNDSGSEVTKANKIDNKELKKARSNEEIRRKIVQTADGVSENNKNIAKKKNNNDNGLKMTKANKNDKNELKKVKSSEDIKRKNVQTGETIVKIVQTVNKNNITENNKNLVMKRNNDNGPEMTKNNKIINKKFKKVKSNEEMKKKNVQTVENKENNKTDNIPNIAKKINLKDNGPGMTQNNRNENKELKKIKSNEEIKTKNVQNVEKNNKNIVKKRKINENGPEMTENNKTESKELKKVKSNEEIKRKNVETGEPNPKKSKSSTDIARPDKKLTKNNENEPNKINTINKQNIDNERPKKQDKNNVIGNKRSEKIVPKTSTPKDKRKDIISKIPQKKISLNSETSIKSNIPRISPRRLPLKTKSISQDINVKQFTKSTNIPRFLKKTVPKTSK